MASIDPELERARLALEQPTTLPDAFLAVYAGLMAVRNTPGQLAPGYGPDRPITLHPTPLWLLVAACDVLEAVAAGRPIAGRGRHGSPVRRILDRNRDLFRYRLIAERLQVGDSKNAACRDAANVLRESPRMVEQAYDRVRKNPARYVDVSKWEGYLPTPRK